ncbi:tetratricopeptide repeat protein [Limnohabitans sp.]|uniref:tetratricopeptide repeat protein n=1 Tax=Limnohabitans sp. TaxID=1907725 RepID=UPI00286EF342|nr:tetratricopeptide repeat protein [Limnohabitans sp.]
MFLIVLGLNACSTSTARLDRLTQAEPDHTRQRAMRRLSLASAYYEQGQTEVAQQEVRAALQIDPDFADAYSLLGLIHQRDNRPVLAQQSFEQAVQLASGPNVRVADLAAIEHNYGWFLCQQNRFDEAQIQFDRAVSRASYRQVDKTVGAIRFCKDRAMMQTGASKSNN